MLPIGASEECEVISLLEKWADDNHRIIRREALMGAEQCSLEGQDLLHRLTLQFLLMVRSRDVA